MQIKVEWKSGDISNWQGVIRKVDQTPPPPDSILFLKLPTPTFLRLLGLQTVSFQGFLTEPPNSNWIWPPPPDS